MESSFLKFDLVEMLLSKIPGWTVTTAHPALSPLAPGQPLTLAKLVASGFVFRSGAGQDEREVFVSFQQIMGIVSHGHRLIVYGIENPYGALHEKHSTCLLTLANASFHPELPYDDVLDAAEDRAEQAAAAAGAAAQNVAAAYNDYFFGPTRATVVIAEGETFVDLPDGVRLAVIPPNR